MLCHKEQGSGGEEVERREGDRERGGRWGGVALRGGGGHQPKLLDQQIRSA